MKKYAQGRPSAVYLPPWRLIGGEVLTPSGGEAANLPDDTTIVYLRAETDDVYYAINTSVINPASAPGLVPSGQAEVIGPLSNFNSLMLSSAAGTARLIYYRED